MIGTCSSGHGACTFPSWLKNETFFSWCSRHDFLSGSPAPDETARVLLGTTARGIKHDFPFHLDAFEENTQGRLGGASVIVAERTILPFFAPFQSASTIDDAVMAMRSGRLGSIKFRLGLLTSRYGADHPLKGCPICMEEDVASHAIAYWHLDHQYPGVLVCPAHQCLLSECVFNRRWSGRFQWTLPRKENLMPIAASPRLPVANDTLIDIGNAACDLAALGFNRRFDLKTVSALYRQRLSVEGETRVNSRHWAPSLLTHAQALRHFHVFSSLPADAAAAATFINGLIRLPRGHTHPLKHLVMITWLFRNVRSFTDAYDKLEMGSHLEQELREPADTVPQPTRAPNPTPKGNLRPKKLKPNVRLDVLSRLSKGEKKAHVCEIFGITISTLNKLLRNEPYTRQAWIECRHALEIRRHRREWRFRQRLAPSLGINALRQSMPKTYAWLYRNDREWLNDQCLGLRSARKGNHSKVVWQTRDENLLQLVHNAVINNYGGDVNGLLSKSRLYALVPSLTNCLEKRGRYPATRAFVQRVTSDE